MWLKIDDELLNVFRSIAKESKTMDEWAETESDDLFQSENYLGGYDADEMAFCFSFFDQRGHEYWFQVGFDQIDRILAGELPQLKLSPADK